MGNQLWYFAAPAILLAGAALLAEDVPVTLKEAGHEIVLSNGRVTLTLASTGGSLTAIQYHHGGETTTLGETMYFDADGGLWPPPPGKEDEAKKHSHHAPLRAGSICRILKRGPELAEVAISGKPSEWFPFETEIHYALGKGESGFWAYAVYRHGKGMAAGGLGQTRFVIKAQNSALYTHHIVDDARQGPFPTAKQVETVQDATFRLADGTIYTKYDNTAYEDGHFVHGMAGHGLGLWIITPNREYANGGPVRQDLTVHMDNVLLCMFQSGHFGSAGIHVAQDEDWTKFYGPFMVYANRGADVKEVWQDAKARAEVERARWPYTWVQHPEYPVQRGAVTGRVRLTDGHSTAGAWVVLTEPVSDWALQSKGYCFWTHAGKAGEFSIPQVRPGKYTLYVSGADQFETFRREDVTVTAGQTTALGELAWTPVTHGRRLWQIGIADRSSHEFKDGENYRHYGNFLRYPANFPEDVTFVIGKSREDRDWNFAQWSWYSRSPVWKIQFSLEGPLPAQATLTIGFASSQPPHGAGTNLQIKANGAEVSVLHLPKSGPAGYRSGNMDSLYQVEAIAIPGKLLKTGLNELTLGHAEALPFSAPLEERRRAFGHVMYDALRLEVQP